MFHSRRLNNRIKHIHEQSLRIIYQDYNPSFAEHLRKDNSLKIHQQNLKLLVAEMLKVQKFGILYLMAAEKQAH